MLSLQLENQITPQRYSNRQELQSFQLDLRRWLLHLYSLDLRSICKHDFDNWESCKAQLPSVPEQLAHQLWVSSTTGSVRDIQQQRALWLGCFSKMKEALVYAVVYETAKWVKRNQSNTHSIRAIKIVMTTVQMWYLSMKITSKNVLKIKLIRCEHEI